MSKLSLILALLLAVMTVSCQSTDANNDESDNPNESGTVVNESADDTDKADETESETESESEETETEAPDESESETAEPEETLAVSDAGEFTAEDLYFAPSADCILAPDSDFGQFTEFLGEPVSFNEAPSCNYDGNDKVYEYDGFTVYTYPAGDADKILIVELFGENCATPKGISVGMSVAEMEASYGTGYVQNGFLYEYSCDNGVLCFTVEGDVISLIEFVSYN